MQDELVKLSSNSKTNPHSSSCCLMTPKLMICSISKHHGITVNPQKCTQKGIHICYISKVAGFSESNPKKTIRLKILMPNAIWHLGIFLNDRQVVRSCSSAQTKLSRQVNHFFSVLFTRPRSANKLPFDFTKVISHIPFSSFI